MPNTSVTFEVSQRLMQDFAETCERYEITPDEVFRTLLLGYVVRKQRSPAQTRDIDAELESKIKNIVLVLGGKYTATEIARMAGIKEFHKGTLAQIGRICRPVCKKLTRDNKGRYFHF